MAMEIEVKMRAPDIEKLQGQLVEYLARRGPVIKEINQFFDTADNDLRRSDQGLRIRSEIHDDNQPMTIIAHKGPRLDGKVKSRSETQVKVDNAEDAMALFTALGLVETIRFEKHRRRWHLDNCLVEIDTLPALGHFVEIEGPSSQAVLDLRKKLGMEHHPLIQQSYAALVHEYLQEQHPQQQQLLFDNS